MHMLPLKALNDIEGQCIPDRIPKIIDSHVHIFPDNIFQSIWKWFDTYAWPIRYRLNTQDVFDFLLSKGISHIIALHYAHKPGLSRYLNSYMIEQCALNPHVSGVATCFPGEPDIKDLLVDAFQSGLIGVKLHMHVQCVDLLSKSMDIIYDLCSQYHKPLIIHAGREPKSSAYACDPYTLCSAEKIKHILQTYPECPICVPHMGADEYTAYQELIEIYNNLWLDTTMVFADYLPLQKPSLLDFRMDRIIYGSDFPNIPYAWDREIQALNNMDLPVDNQNQIFYTNAESFFSLSTQIQVA